MVDVKTSIKYKNSCGVCGGAGAKRCGRCHAVWYCSVEHQKSDWSTHKDVCALKEPFAKTLDNLYELGTKSGVPTVNRLFMFKHALNLIALNRAEYAKYIGKMLQFVYAIGHVLYQAGLWVDLGEWVKTYKQLWSPYAIQQPLNGWEELLASVAKEDMKSINGLAPETPSLIEKIDNTECMLRFSKFMIISEVRQSENAKKRFKTDFFPDDFLKLEFPFRPRAKVLMEKGVEYFNQQIAVHELSQMHVVYTEKKGFDIVAHADYKVGDIVWVEEPYVAITCDLERCHHCLDTLPDKAVPCRGKCDGIRFCNSKCEERANSSYHRALCGADWQGLIKHVVDNGKTSSSKQLPLLLRAAGMALCLNDEKLWEHAPLKYLANQSTIGTFDNRLQHLASSLQNCGLKMLLNVLLANKKQQPDKWFDIPFNYEWVQEMSSVMMGNLFSFSVENDQSTRFKLLLGPHAALCGVGSLFNHSCVANCSWSMMHRDGAPFVVFVATKEIKKGESVTVSYGPTGNQPLEQRRLGLALYQFNCDCQLCTEQSKPTPSTTSHAAVVDSKQ